MKIVRKQPKIELVEVTEPKEGIMMKVGNWSLKKKILVGAGVVGTAILGVFAYCQCTQTDEVEYDGSDLEDEEDGEVEYDDEELAELVQMEKEEELKKETEE